MVTPVPSRTRIAPKLSVVDGAVATTVFPTTLSPSVPFLEVDAGAGAGRLELVVRDHQAP